MYKYGSLKIIFGAMFSYKTTHLLKDIEQIKLINKPFLTFNYFADTRYGYDIISSHNKVNENCNMIFKISNIFEHPKYNNAEYIFIDEIQFFKDIVNDIVKMVETDHKNVIICGLYSDANRNLFGELYKLIPYADEIRYYKGLCLKCSDGTPSSFTMKNNKNTPDIIIGGDNIFSSVCRYHYLNDLTVPIINPNANLHINADLDSLMKLNPINKDGFMHPNTNEYRNSDPDIENRYS